MLYLLMHRVQPWSTSTHHPGHHTRLQTPVKTKSEVVFRTQPIGREYPISSEGLCHKNLPAIQSQDLRLRW